jgi:hypothetical protein
LRNENFSFGKFGALNTRMQGNVLNDSEDIYSKIELMGQKQKNILHGLLVSKRTIPTELPPLVEEI